VFPERPRDPLFIPRSWLRLLNPGDKFLFEEPKPGGKGAGYTYAEFQGWTEDADYVACRGYNATHPTGREVRVHLSRVLYPIHKRLFPLCKQWGWPGSLPSVRALTLCTSGGSA